MDVRYLILVLTARCNLRCRYCYHGDTERPADMSMAVLEQAVGLAATAGSHFHLQVTGGEPTLVPALNSQILASRERSLDSCAVLNFYGKFRLWEGFLTFSMDNIFDEEVQVSGDLTEDATNRYAYYEVGRLFKAGYEIDF